MSFAGASATARLRPNAPLFPWYLPSILTRYVVPSTASKIARLPLELAVTPTGLSDVRESPVNTSIAGEKRVVSIVRIARPARGAVHWYQTERPPRAGAGS